MNPRPMLRVMLACCATWLCAVSLAQDLVKPTNLRVLPRDTSPADIKSLMEQYGQELGVKCEHCHSPDPHTQQLDYAADDNPAKQTARVMIAMLQEINDKYLAQLDDRKYAVLVTCGNCHQGQADPPTFERVSNPTSATTVQWTAVLAGTTLELSGAILDGWHVYALTQPPGGPTALRITLDDTEVVEAAGSPVGPAPQKRRDPSFGLVSEFYTHTFTVRLPVKVKQPGATIPISVRFQTCSDRECQPPTTIHLSVPLGGSPSA